MGKQKSRLPIFSSEFPAEVEGSAPFVSLVPGKEATVAGCKGLLCVEEDGMILSLGRWRAKIQGSELALSALEEGVCRVTGRVLGVSFSGSKSKGEKG